MFCSLMNYLLLYVLPIMFHFNSSVCSSMTSINWFKAIKLSVSNNKKQMGHSGQLNWTLNYFCEWGGGAYSLPQLFNSLIWILKGTESKKK